MKFPIIIVTHTVYVDNHDVHGPGHAISDVLNEKKVNHIYIKHSLYDNRPIKIEKYKLGKLFQNENGNNSFFRRYLGYIVVIVDTLKLLFKVGHTKVYIGINPLNYIAGFLGKLLGKVDIVIFYTADYATQRFKNPLLNVIYHLIDRFAISTCDYVWNVSSRITKIRKNQGIADNKNILVPNSPSIQLIQKFRSQQRISNSLVLIANFTPAIDYDTIINSIHTLTSYFKNIKITFIGTGKREAEIKRFVESRKLTKNINFAGYKTHREALDIIGKHSVGLAVYANEWSWTAYGDSMKAREYIGLGLPVIITNNVSTADDIAKYNAGISIKLTEDNLVHAIFSILSNKKLYQQMHKNALLLANSFDFYRILDSHLMKLI